MKYQNICGERVVLYPIVSPPSEFDHVETGNAFLEKLVNEKLLNLHNVVARNNDPQLADFIESECLDEQVMKKLMLENPWRMMLPKCRRLRPHNHTHHMSPMSFHCPPYRNSSKDMTIIETVGDEFMSLVILSMFASLKTELLKSILSSYKDAYLRSCPCLVLLCENSTARCFHLDQIGHFQHFKGVQSGYVSYMLVSINGGEDSLDLHPSLPLGWKDFTTLYAKEKGIMGGYTIRVEISCPETDKVESIPQCMERSTTKMDHVVIKELNSYVLFLIEFGHRLYTGQADTYLHEIANSSYTSNVTHVLVGLYWHIGLAPGCIYYTTLYDRSKGIVCCFKLNFIVPVHCLISIGLLAQLKVGGVAQNGMVGFVQQGKKVFPNLEVVDRQEYLVAICLDDTQLLSTILYACVASKYVAVKIIESANGDTNPGCPRTIRCSTVVDDFFDVGSSQEEQENLIQLVEKWDVDVNTVCCSEAAKSIFSALCITICEIGEKSV
ncbi:ent-kaurene synthase [Trifolium repens]|nr:ent-kaurene synthase [Trifolium repens]